MTRGINITRTVTIETADEKTGKVTAKKVKIVFPCKVNAGVPSTHRMIALEH